MIGSGSIFASHVLDIGDLRIDRTSAVATANGATLSLGAKVVATLLALHECAGDVVSKATLIERVWGDSPIDESSLWQNVHLLRGALKRHAPGTRIETVKGRGYRLVLEDVVVPAELSPAIERVPVVSGIRRLKLPAWLWSIAGAAAAALVFGIVQVAHPMAHPHRVLVLIGNSSGSLPALPPLPTGDDHAQIVLAPIIRN